MGIEQSFTWKSERISWSFARLSLGLSPEKTSELRGEFVWRFLVKGEDSQSSHLGPIIDRLDIGKERRKGKEGFLPVNYGLLLLLYSCVDSVFTQKVKKMQKINFLIKT